MSGNILGPEWFITPEGLNLLTENSSSKDYKVIYKAALDTDLKEIGAPILREFLCNTKTLQKCVLQIQKVRNISAPKANEGSQAAPRMLKLTLTDGDSYIQAIEVSTISSISREKTAPGTKVLININRIVSGYLLLSDNNCTVLGGKVPHLYEKWELAKSIQQTRQITSISGAPPWVNFGCKIQATNQDGSFKSLTAKQKENKDNAEFEQQRQEAIAEAASGAVKKTFGGRVKQNVQPAVTQPQKRNYENRDRKGGRIKTAFKESDVDEKPSKPSDKVSLFSFLEDKLPTAEVKSSELSKSAYQKQPHYQNHEKNYPVLSSIQNAQKSPNQSFSSSDNRQQSNRGRPDNVSHYQQKSSYPNKQNNYYVNQQNTSSFNQNSALQSQQRSTGFVNNTPRHQQQDNYNRNSVNRQDNSYTHSNYNHNLRRQHDRTVPQQKQETSYEPPSSANQPNKTVDNLADGVAKISVNNEFASRSLRQHLNLNVFPKRNEDTNRKNVDDYASTLKLGDECMAKYWEDGKLYNAIITAITDKTYAVQFKGYGNIEEVLKTDCHLVKQSNYHQNSKQNTRPHAGICLICEKPFLKNGKIFLKKQFKLH